MKIPINTTIGVDVDYEINKIPGKKETERYYYTITSSDVHIDTFNKFVYHNMLNMCGQKGRRLIGITLVEYEHSKPHEKARTYII